MRRVMAASAAALAMTLTVLIGPARPASALTGTDIHIAEAAHWAASQVGKPYVYGGIGPYGYDCSGLVYTAYRRYGFALPRTTYQLLASWHLYRVSSPRRGDRAFYGSGHVEILTGTWGVTFGMLHSGTVAGYHRWNAYWYPTAFYRVR
jgi:cell wall-associated NlpC family hydrolase